MRRFLAVLLLLMLAIPQPVWADAAPVAPVGAHLQPMASTTVSLAEERIEIQLRRAESGPSRYSWDAVAEYRIWFRFVPAMDEALELGFPLFVVDEEKGIMGAPIQDLTVEVDGQQVAAEVRSGVWGKEAKGANSSWATFPVTFRAGQPSEMVIRYSMPAEPFGKSQAASFWIAYVLETGALWAGPIGRIEAVISMDKPIRAADIDQGAFAERRTTPGWTLQNGVLSWVWENVEPDFNLSLVMANPYWLDAEADILSLLETAAGDRTTLLKAMDGTRALFAGGRLGEWADVRGGVSAKDVAESLLPSVMDAWQVHMALHPQDWEVWLAYLSLLRESAVHYGLDGPEVLSEERLAFFLQELHRYNAGGGPATDLKNWRPWLLVELRSRQWSGETQEAIAAVLADAMPESFPSEDAVSAWVAENAGSALDEAHVDGLLAEGMRRIAPPAPEDGTAPGGEASSTAGRDWLPWAGGLLLLVGAAGILTWWLSYCNHRA